MAPIGPFSAYFADTVLSLDGGIPATKVWRHVVFMTCWGACFCGKAP